MTEAARPPRPDPVEVPRNAAPSSSPPSALPVVPNVTNTVRLVRGARIVHRLELEDVTFHTDSAVFLPAGPRRAQGAPETPEQARLGGLLALRTVIQFCELHPEKRLLVAGHTDTTGSDAHNQKLSRLRAENVVAYLRGERATWVASCEARHKGEDLQAILAWVAETRGWDTDPGKVDGIVGPNTRRALDALRRRWNDEGRAPALPATGPLARADWGAFYDLYDEELARLFAVPPGDLAARRARVAWVEPAGVGCGEHWPIDRVGIDDHRSLANRRVELLLFDPDEVPPLDCHAGGGCAPTACVLYDAAKKPKYKAEHLPADVRSFRFLLEAEGGRPWSDEATVRIVSEDGAHERSYVLGGAPRRKRFRTLVFPDARPGVLYRGELRDRERVVPLFGAVELFRLQDPLDPTTNHLPLPVLTAPPDDGPPAPDDPHGEPGDDRFEPDAVDAAAESGIPLGFLLALPAFDPGAELRLVAEDGSDERRVPLASALSHGELRAAGLGRPRPGVRYRGEVVTGALTLPLFGAVELARVLDPADPLNHLPLPEVAPPGADGPPAPDDPQGEPGDDRFEADAIDAAAESGIPRGFVLAVPAFEAGAELRLVAEDGSDERRVALASALSHGDLRAAGLGRPRAGVRYRGEVVSRARVVPLFGHVELARVLAPDDPLNHLPLPDVAPPADDGPPPPEDPHGEPGVDDPDEAAVARAAEPPPVTGT